MFINTVDSYLFEVIVEEMKVNNSLKFAKINWKSTLVSIFVIGLSFIERPYLFYILLGIRRYLLVFRQERPILGQGKGSNWDLFANQYLF